MLPAMSIVVPLSWCSGGSPKSMAGWLLRRSVCRFGARYRGRADRPWRGRFRQVAGRHTGRLPILIMSSPCKQMLWGATIKRLGESRMKMQVLNFGVKRTSTMSTPYEGAGDCEIRASSIQPAPGRLLGSCRRSLTLLVTTTLRVRNI